MQRTTNIRSTLLAAACASALALACSAEGMGEEDIATIGEAVLFNPPGSQTVNFGQSGFSWRYGFSGVQMTPTATSTCFLNGVSGTFKSHDDRVEIVRKVIGGQEFWVLGGTKGTGSPAGSAFCLTDTTIVPGSEHDWENDAPVALDIGHTPSTACYLTAVWGNLGGIDEYVRTLIVGAQWQLDGNSAGGSAKCIRRASFSPIDLPVSGKLSGSAIFANSTNFFSTGPVACGLTRVSGIFRGGSVLIYNWHFDATHWDWRMITSANTNFPPSLWTTGSGRCVQ